MVAGGNQTARRVQGYFKAIFKTEWEEGLVKKVNEEFGTKKFTYMIYCTWRAGDDDQLRARTIAGNRITIVTLKDIFKRTVQRINDKPDKSVEPTTLSRFVQLVKATGMELTPN